MKLAEYVAEQLCSIAEVDDTLFVIDGDLADSEGADRFASRYPERFLMTGISEQNLVGVAAGLASVGRKPWAFSFAAFLICRAFDQIRIGLAQSRQPVVLVGSHAGGLSARNGKSHAVLNDIAMMATLPHVEVFAPADRADIEWLTSLLTERPRAAYLRLPRADVDTLPPLGGAAGPIRMLAAPRRQTIVTTGLATHWGAALTRRLATRGIQAGLVHVPCLKPFPDLAEVLGQTEAILTIEDHVTLGGLGSLIQDRFPDRVVRKLGWPVEFAGASGSDEDLRLAHGLDLDALEAASGFVAVEEGLECSASS